MSRQLTKFKVSDTERLNFYELIDRSYRKLESRLDIIYHLYRDHESRLRRIERTFLLSRKREKHSINYYSPFWERLLSEEFILRNLLVDRTLFEQEVDNKLVIKIYSPIALTSFTFSVLMFFITVFLTSPFLGIPFALSAAFSLYYLHRVRRHTSPQRKPFRVLLNKIFEDLY